MAKVPLATGKTYRAKLSLPFLVSQNMAKSRLEAAGFKDVQIYEMGSTVYAQGTWTGETGDYDLPSQVQFVWAV